MAEKQMVLLEREAELEAFASAFAKARRGRGSVVLVAGEAGIGKTKLIQAFTEDLADKVRIVWGGCDDLSTPRALGPFRDIGHQLGGDLDRVLASGAARTEVFDAILSSLTVIPTVAVIEDVHWADAATLDVLKFIGRRIERISLLLIISYRNEELGPDHELFATIGDLPASSVHRLLPAPLSRAAVARLASNYAGSADDLYVATGGNPFLVTESVASEGAAVPGSVRDGVRARTVRLSPPARSLVERISVIPGVADRILLDRVEPVDVATLDECHGRALLEYNKDAIWFRHELVRGAVEAALSPKRRRRLNQELAEVMAAVGGDVARIVHHARQAGDADMAARFAPVAGRQAAAASSHREAMSQYRLAAHYSDRLEQSEAAAVMTEYATECYLVNQPQEGLVAAQRALVLWREIGDHEREGEILRLLSRLHWWLGNPKEAETDALASIEVLEAVGESDHLPMAYSNMAQLFMLAQRTELADSWALKAIDCARRIDDQAALAHALNNLGSSRARSGDLRGREQLHDSLDISLAEGLEDHAGRAYANLIWVALDIRDYEEAERLLEDGLAYARDRELTGNVHYLTAERARLHFERSDWSQAEQSARWVLARPEVAGITQMPALTTLARIQVRRGDVEANATLEDAWYHAEPSGELQRIWPIAAARAEAAWLRGDRAAIAATVQNAHRLAVEAQQPWVTDELAFWLWRGGIVDERHLGGTPFALQMGGEWRAAAQEWDELGCPYEQATALLDSEIADDLVAAIGILDELGAAPAARLARTKLEDLGVSSAPPLSRTRRAQDAASLTARQLDVLRLMADGLSDSAIADRLYISTQTVEHHISVLLARLDLASRDEAVSAAAEMAITTPTG